MGLYIDLWGVCRVVSCKVLLPEGEGRVKYVNMGHVSLPESATLAQASGFGSAITGVSVTMLSDRRSFVADASDVLLVSLVLRWCP